MLRPSHPLLYACVSQDQTLVAELTAAAPDPSLPALAAAILAVAPPHHRHVTHSADGRAHALLLAPPLSLLAVSLSPALPPSHLLLFLRRLRCLHPGSLPEEMPRLALSLPFPDDDALAREAAEVAAAEEEAARREMARRPKREAAAGRWTWRGQLRVVLLVDLVLLCVLFAAWLAVCKRFRCIGR